MGPKRTPQPPRPRPRALPAGPSKDADSVFREYPHIEFQASGDPEIMAVKFEYMVNGFLKEIIRQSAKENGEAQFLLKIPLMREEEFQDKCRLNFFPVNQSAVLRFQQQISVLPSSGYLVVVLRPAALWSYQKGEDGHFLLDHRGEPQVKKPMKFLFRLCNLYLQGYLSTDKWKLFNDVKLKGVISGADIHKFTTKLPYDSSYGRTGMEINFRTLQVGYDSLQSVYKVLSDSGRRYSEAQKQEALAVIAVTCSESTRRRCIYYWMRALFRSGLSQNVDCAPPPGTEEVPAASSTLTSIDCPSPSDGAKKAKTEPKQPGSDKFLTWSKDCIAVREGPEFDQDISDEKAAKLVEEYNRALRDVVVILPRT